VRSLIGTSATRWLTLALLGALALGVADFAEAKKKKKKKHDVPMAEIAPGYMRAPYLQALGTDSVTVAWVASDTGEPMVDFGPTTEFGSTVSAQSNDAHRAATLRGLQPGTWYFYQVRAGDRVLATGEGLRFRTDEGSADRSFNFFVTGDIGSKKEQGQIPTGASILRADPRPEMGILCGDIIYKKGNSKNYDRRLMRPWQDLFSQMSIWPALGNHDWKSDPAKNWEKEWYLPNNEHYYSFDYGNAHFIALDTRDGDLYDRENQVRWLERDLAEHQDADWLFVYYHHPGITCTYKKYNDAVVEYFIPLFDRYRVDVAFAGHAHTYERTYPLYRGEVVSEQQDPQYVDPQGTIYIVSGAGAKPKKKKPTTLCGPTATFRDNTLLWTQVLIEGSTCTIRTWTSEGDELVDEVIIRKTDVSG